MVAAEVHELVVEPPEALTLVAQIRARRAALSVVHEDDVMGLTTSDPSEAW